MGIPAHIRIGKVLNVVIFDTNNCLICSVLLKLYKKLEFYTSSDHESNQNEY